MSETWIRCGGINVHKDTVVVCVPGADGSRTATIRKTCGTFLGELIRLRVWLKRLRTTHIVLVNPARVKPLQGRKSDQRDAKQIAEFLQEDRLSGSYIPTLEIRKLRMLTAVPEQRNEANNPIRDLLEPLPSERAGRRLMQSVTRFTTMAGGVPWHGNNGRSDRSSSAGEGAPFARASSRQGGLALRSIFRNSSVNYPAM